MLRRFTLILLSAAGLAACDDGLDPDPWNDTPVEVSLYSASRLENLGLPSALDVVSIITLRVENPGTTGNFDVILGTQGSQLVLIPAGALEGQNSRAGVATISGQTFETLETAPDDTAAFSSQPVPITAGGLYVIRSRRFTCSFSSAVNYAKVKVNTVDVAAGAATFSVVRNPYCNDRSFVPPED